jgi:hypothetical protein
MRNLVIVLAIVLQQACTTGQPDMEDISTMIDSPTAIKWECVTTASSFAPIEFTAVYDAESGNGYLESGGEKLYTKSNFFAKSSKWSPPDVFIPVLQGKVRFYISGKYTRMVPARCVEL